MTIDTVNLVWSFGFLGYMVGSLGTSFVFKERIRSGAAKLAFLFSTIAFTGAVMVILPFTSRLQRNKARIAGYYNFCLQFPGVGDGAAAADRGAGRLLHGGRLAHRLPAGPPPLQALHHGSVGVQYQNRGYSSITEFSCIARRSTQ